MIKHTWVINQFSQLTKNVIKQNVRMFKHKVKKYLIKANKLDE